jgi:hypothetical protein
MLATHHARGGWQFTVVTGNHFRSSLSSGSTQRRFPPSIDRPGFLGIAISERGVIWPPIFPFSLKMERSQLLIVRRKFNTLFTAWQQLKIHKIKHDDMIQYARQPRAKSTIYRGNYAREIFEQEHIVVSYFTTPSKYQRTIRYS